MRPANRHEARRRAAEQARDAFLRAAAALTEPSTESRAFALLEGAKGMLALAEADDERQSAREIVMGLIQEAKGAG